MNADCRGQKIGTFAAAFPCNLSDNDKTSERVPQAPDRPSPLETLSEKAAAEYLRRSSLTFLECAINLMATHMSLEEVAAILRTEADQLDEMR